MGVYLLLGDDEERRARGVERLRRDRAAESYDASETGPEAVVSACNSYSLFGEGPFVIVRNLDAWNAAQKAVVVDYLDNPAPEADLVLLGKKLGAREKLLAAVKKSGEVHNFEQPTGKALVRWVVGHAKKQGLDLPDDVARDLIERCSGDKIRLITETEKLALYVGEDAATHEDVEALAACERGRALKLLEDLISTGEPALRLTYMIRRQFNLVARTRALLDRGTPPKEIAAELKVPPFVARKLEEQGRTLSHEDLEKTLESVLELERGLKGGKDLGDELQVELTVLRLSDSTRPRASPGAF